MLYGFFRYEKCVHTEHCCIEHGCKYGDDDCPVATGIKYQSYRCEYCYEDGTTIEDLQRSFKELTNG